MTDQEGAAKSWEGRARSQGVGVATAAALGLTELELDQTPGGSKSNLLDLDFEESRLRRPVPPNGQQPTVQRSDLDSASTHFALVALR